MTIKPAYLALCVALCLGLAVAAPACKQNSIAATTNNNQTVSQVVGVGGATVNGPDGSEVSIPPGALTQSTTISITEFASLPDPPLPPLPAAWTALGKVFEFQPLPPTLTFAKEVTVLVPYTTASSRPSLATVLPGGQWLIVTSMPQGMALELGTSQFAYYVVVDAGAMDAGLDATVDADAGPDCAAELAQRLSAPILPPTKFAGYDLSTGADPRGLSIDEINDGCLMPDPAGSQPGLRFLQLSSSIQLGYVIDDHILNLVNLGTGYTGLLSFTSRAGGPYGTHTYQIQIGQPLLRDGVSFSEPGEWNTAQNDAGQNTASAWVNEIYDGIVATFHIGFANAQECLSNGSLCLVAENAGGGTSEVGIRSIGLYLVFNQDTNVVTGIYEFYTPSNPDCQTPIARHEQEIASPIYPVQYRSIGGVQLAPSSSPGGITVAQANALLCSGVDASAPDPGYGAMQWGDAGQILLEYNSASQIAYKLFARSGYNGTLTFQGQSSPDAAVDNYAAMVGPGGLTKNGNPFPITWTSEATAVPAVTELSNQLQGFGDCGLLRGGQLHHRRQRRQRPVRHWLQQRGDRHRVPAGHGQHQQHLQRVVRGDVDPGPGSEDADLTARDLARHGRGVRANRRAVHGSGGRGRPEPGIGARLD